MTGPIVAIIFLVLLAAFMPVWVWFVAGLILVVCLTGWLIERSEKRKTEQDEEKLNL